MNNLITSLLLFINNPEVCDTDYQIAYCLLSHCHEISTMTVQELAEKSYVSVSTINRFLKTYGFNRYAIFKEAFNQHVHVRMMQMETRLKEKKQDQVNAVMKHFLNEEAYEQVVDQKKIDQLCECMKASNRIVLMGSDEMVAQSLRFQGDMIVMGHHVVKNSIYPRNMFIPKSDDCVIILSMSGRIFDLSNHLLENISVNQPTIWMCGHHNYMDQSDHFLYVPDGIDELLENLIFDYYLQTITYTYATRYGYDH